MEKIRHWMIVTVMSFLFWGMVYPQLTLTKDTYYCIKKEESSPQQDFNSILKAKPGEIKIKSKVLEWVDRKIREK